MPISNSTALTPEKCSQSLSVSLIKQPEQSNFGKERAYLALAYTSRSQSITDLARAGTQAEMQSRKHTLLLLAYSPAHAGLWSSSFPASFLVLLRTTCLVNGTAHNGMGPPILVSKQGSPSETNQVETITHLRLSPHPAPR